MSTKLTGNFGRYIVEGEIGRGSMGVVYLARDPKIGRLVAIKTISLLCEDYAEERQHRDRFILEARAAGKLSHPGIVTIFDIGEEVETPYIVMEYVSGQALSTMMWQGSKKLSLPMSLRIIQQTAEALDYAHSRGVVHRDIKPQNILISEEGNPKITDFGIAKFTRAHLTVPGQVLGSPAYIAPEQLNGELVDGRSDLFSLGVILYTLLAGYRPFQGNSAMTVCFKVVNHNPPPVTAFDTELPPQLAAIVSRAIAKNPAERYQTGREMAAVIGQLLLNNDAADRSPDNWTRGFSPDQLLANSKTADHRPAVLRSGKWARGWSAVSRKTVVLGIGLVLGISSLIYGYMRSRYASATAHKAVSQWLPEAQPILQQTSAPPVSVPLKPDARVQIDIQHQFAKAHASVWLDNKLVYSRDLYSAAKPRLLVFRRRSHAHVSEMVQLPAGKHRMRVRLQSVSDAFDETKAFPAILKPNSESTLRIDVNKKNKQLQIELKNL